MSRHVFVSYSRQDKTYVKGLVAQLRDAGIEVWIDESLEPGTPIWVKTIEQAIVDCVALVPVMTTSSAESVWVDREIDLAQELGKPIFPLLVTGRRFMRLRDIQTEDATAGGLPSGAFLASLARVAGGASPIAKQVPAARVAGGVKPTQFRVLSSGTSAAHSLAWSPDGRLLAGAGAGSAWTAYVWDVEAASVRFTVERRESQLKHVTWAPDGARLATIHQDGTIWTWAADSGAPIKQIVPSEKMFGIQYPMRYSPDGSELAVGGLGAFYLPPSTTVQVPSDVDSVGWVAWAPDGARLAVSTINNVFVCDLTSKNFVLDIDQRAAGTVMTVEWSPDGATLITANADSTISMWTSTTGKLVRTLNGHSKDVLWAGFSPDGKLVASCGGDRTFRLWDAAIGTPLFSTEVTGHQQGTMSRIWSGDKNRVIAGVWSPSGEHIATSSNDGSVRIWSLR